MPDHQLMSLRVGRVGCDPATYLTNAGPPIPYPPTPPPPHPLISLTHTVPFLRLLFDKFTSYSPINLPTIHLLCKR